MCESPMRSKFSGADAYATNGRAAAEQAAVVTARKRVIDTNEGI